MLGIILERIAKIQHAFFCLPQHCMEVWRCVIPDAMPFFFISNPVQVAFLVFETYITETRLLLVGRQQNAWEANLGSILLWEEHTLVAIPELTSTVHHEHSQERHKKRGTSLYLNNMVTKQSSFCQGLGKKVSRNTPAGGHPSSVVFVLHWLAGRDHLQMAKRGHVSNSLE